MAWATTADVRAFTDETVDAQTVAAAQGIIETAARLVEADVTAGDVRHPWLVKAVAYQAAFLHVHPDWYGQLDVASETLEGSTLRMREDGWAAVLSPLAKQALAAAGIEADAPVAIPVPSGLFPPPPPNITDLEYSPVTRRRPRRLILQDGTEVDL